MPEMTESVILAAHFLVFGMFYYLTVQLLMCMTDSNPNMLYRSSIYPMQMDVEVPQLASPTRSILLFAFSCWLSTFGFAG